MMPENHRFLIANCQGRNQIALKGRPVSPVNGAYLEGGISNHGAVITGNVVDRRKVLENETWKDANYYWTHVVIWGVVAQGELHAATNTGVRLLKADIRFHSRRTQEWHLVTRSPANGNFDIGAKNLPYLCEDAASFAPLVFQDDASSVAEIQFLESGNAVHWWIKGRIPIPDYQHLDCIYVRVDGELYQIDTAKPNDFEAASIAMNAAIDNYPDETSPISDPPMAIGSSFRKLHTDKETIVQAASIQFLPEVSRQSDYNGPVNMSWSDFLATYPTFLPNWS